MSDCQPCKARNINPAVKWNGAIIGGALAYGFYQPSFVSQLIGSSVGYYVLPMLHPRNDQAAIVSGGASAAAAYNLGYSLPIVAGVGAGAYFVGMML